ncbi:MAG: hypothetical protein LBU85_12390 [Treponema sp.]|jgi:hypothetical protein|nr:hypothetical protein [Treponema sp.]
MKYFFIVITIFLGISFIECKGYKKKTEQGTIENVITVDTRIYNSEITNTQGYNNLETTGKGKIKYVFLADGINLHAEPDIESSIKLTLRQYTKLYEISKTVSEKTINGISHFWYKVDTEGSIGWVCMRSLLTVPCSLIP